MFFFFYILFLFILYMNYINIKKKKSLNLDSSNIYQHILFILII